MGQQVSKEEARMQELRGLFFLTEQLKASLLTLVVEAARAAAACLPDAPSSTKRGIMPFGSTTSNW
jgi:hypothetical protein